MNIVVPYSPQMNIVVPYSPQMNIVVPYSPQMNTVVPYSLQMNIVVPYSPQMNIGCNCITCWLPKATNTRFQYMLYLLLFHRNNRSRKAPHCYVILYCLFCKNMLSLQLDRNCFFSLLSSV